MANEYGSLGWAAHLNQEAAWQALPGQLEAAAAAALPKVDEPVVELAPPVVAPEPPPFTLADLMPAPVRTEEQTESVPARVVAARTPSPRRTRSAQGRTVVRVPVQAVTKSIPVQASAPSAPVAAATAAGVAPAERKKGFAWSSDDVPRLVAAQLELRPSQPVRVSAPVPAAAPSPAVAPPTPSALPIPVRRQPLSFSRPGAFVPGIDLSEVNLSPLGVPLTKATPAQAPEVTPGPVVVDPGDEPTLDLSPSTEPLSRNPNSTLLLPIAELPGTTRRQRAGRVLGRLFGRLRAELTGTYEQPPEETPPTTRDEYAAVLRRHGLTKEEIDHTFRVIDARRTRSQQ